MRRNLSKTHPCDLSLSALMLLASGTPHQDILLSPQHRVLLGGWRMELVMGSDEGLAAIVYLVMITVF